MEHRTISRAERFARTAAQRRAKRPDWFPAVYWADDLETYVPKPQTSDAYEQAVRWLNGLSDRQALKDGSPLDRAGYGQGLFLYGPFGTGKTTLAVATLLSFWFRGAGRARYVPFVDLVRASRPQQTFIRYDGLEDYSDIENARTLVTDARDVHLLLLDDVGRGNASEFTAGVIEDVIRGRYLAGKPTIITSNLSPDDWAKRYGEGVADFLYQAFADMVFVGGRSMRGQGG